MFAPLHIKTRFSPLGSLLTPDDVVKALQDRQIPACAVRDDGTLYGAYAVRKAAAGTGIRVAIGVDLPVSIAIRDGNRVSAVIGALAVGSEGEEALNRLVRLYWDRKERGIPSLSLSDLSAHGRSLQFILSASDGPILRCLRKGRLAAAWKVAAALYGAVGRRILLETGRTGVEDEELTEPFYREMASRFELTVVASSPVRYLRQEDQAILSAVSALSPEETIATGHSHFPSPLAMRNRYGNDAPAVEATLHAVTACTQSDMTSRYTEESRDRFLRSCLAKIATLYQTEPKWKREEIDRRFWREYWKLEEEGNLGVVVSLAQVVDRAKASLSEQSFRIAYLEGTILSYLLGWTGIDPVKANLLPASGDEHQETGIIIEGSSKFLRTLRSMLTSTNNPEYVPSIEPQELSKEDLRLLVESFESPGKGAGHDPKKRSTHSLFEPHNRTNHRPVPSERMQSLLKSPFVASFAVRRNRFTLQRARDFGWTENALGSVRLHVSDLHEALSLTGNVQGMNVETLPSWDAEWIKLFAAMPLVEERKGGVLKNASDWNLMLQSSDTTRRISELISRIRNGEVPKPLIGKRIDGILDETEGIPVYREQFVLVIQALTGYAIERAELLFDKLENDDPRMLARERHDFIAAVVQQGGSSLYGDRVFSYLLPMAEQAIPRVQFAELGEMIRRVMSFADQDRDRFWARLINRLHQEGKSAGRKRAREWMALSVKEGIEWKPVSINESSEQCEVTEPGVIRHGLSGIPGLNRSEASAILRARQTGGNFASATHFLDRMLGSGISRPVLLRLARSLHEDGFRLERRGVRAQRKPQDEHVLKESAQVSLPFLDAVS